MKAIGKVTEWGLGSVPHLSADTSRVAYSRVPQHFCFLFFSVKDVRIFRCFFNSSVDTGGRWLLDSSVDDADREDQSLQLKALLHVAATRAKEHLRISWAGRKSKFLPEKVWSR